MKAILIARVSTEEQKEAGNSLPAQVVRLENYCRNKGFEVLKVCSFDESAYTHQRNEFDIIINFILAQAERVIVCCDKVDRLSRNIFDKRISILYEKALQDEIELHFVSDGQVINSRISAVEKFQFGISLGLAKYYSDAISDNVKRALEQKLRKGEWPARAPYGYKNIKIDDKAEIIVDDYEAKVIQKIFQLYATGTYSMQLLCDKVKKEHGLNWAKGFMDHVLKNTFYRGIMEWKGVQYPHKYPPIVSNTLFDQVNQVKANFNKKPAKFAGLPYIYRGLIRCNDCGLSITPEKHKGFVYYHCTQYNGKHNAKWLREEEITKQLGKVFKSMQISKDIIQQIIPNLRDVHEQKSEFHAKEFDALTKGQKQVTKMMENLYLDKLKGSITESSYDKYYQSFRDQLDDITVRFSQLQDAENNYYITSKYILDLANRAYDLFLSSEVEERRQLIKLVLSNLRLDGEKVLYEAVKPFDVIIKYSNDQAWCAR